MGLTVRYPNGLAITYNDAHVLEHGSTCWNLYESEKRKKWIAAIQPSAGVIVEAKRPCLIENPQTDLTEQGAVELVKRMFRKKRHADGCGAEVAEIKRLLQQFDARYWTWRE
jgi:hypothetical protein